jgi:hypothetical protein
MSNKSNDEKLIILQERLAQIKQKKDTPIPQIQQKEEVIEVATAEIEIPKKERKPISLGWVKYVVIIGVVGYGSFYAYKNIDFSNLTSSKEITEEPKEFVLEYNLNLKGDNISIISSFEDENSAKIMVNDLKVKGYKCDYFYLPNKSNSSEELYKVFIGPYENNEETNQWIENIDLEFEIIKL